jgi:hypothetical protein
MQRQEGQDVADARAPFARMAASEKLYVCLAAVFVSCLLLGDVTGGKIIWTPLGAISVGVIPFPVTFLLTDVVNDFYGRKGARFLTWVGFGMAILAWIVLQIGTWLRPDPTTYFTQEEFTKIFGGSSQLFVASIIAYLVGQFLDINVFQFWKAITQSRHLWLRATGSTLLSQIVDTLAVNLIFNAWVAYTAPASELGKMLAAGTFWGWLWAKIGREYGIKLVVAIFLTPVVYAIHAAIVRVLKIAPEAHETRG